MRIKTQLSERASEELLAIMTFYNFTSTNHTMNVMVGQLYKSLNLNPAKEESNNESESKNRH